MPDVVDLELGSAVLLGLYVAERFRSACRPPPHPLGLPVVVLGLGPCRTSGDDHPAGKMVNDMLIRS